MDLITAVNDGDVSAFNFFLNFRADVNQKSNGRTALMQACSRGHVNFVQPLIKNSADMNLQSNSGCTAIMFASDRKNYECLNLLISAKADLNIRNHDGDTALHQCTSSKNYPFVRHLIASGCELNITNNYNETILDIAVKDGDFCNMLLFQMVTFGARLSSFLPISLPFRLRIQLRSMLCLWVVSKKSLVVFDFPIEIAKIICEFQLCPAALANLMVRHIQDRPLSSERLN